MSCPSARKRFAKLGRLTDVSEIESKEDERPHLRMRAVRSPRERMPREERVLQILAERAAQPIGDLVQPTLVSS